MDQEPIELRFTTQPTTSDFVANAAAVMRRSAVTLVIGAFATTVAAITLYLGDLVGVFLLVAGLSMLTGLFMVPFVWFAIRQRRDLVLASVDVEADADGLTMTTARASSRQAWSVYREVRETSRAFLLNTGAGAAILLAKRGMDADQVRTFRELLARVGLIRPRSAFDRVRPALWVALGAVLGIGLILAPRLISGADATATMGIATSTTGSMVTVEGTTDLPDGAIVVVQLVQADEWDRESADGVTPDVATSPWIRSDDATVRDGRFTASIDVDVWPAGRGRAAAYFWIDGMQPADVVERFGFDGSDLRGPDVVDLEGFGPTLTVQDAFVIAD